MRKRYGIFLLLPVIFFMLFLCVYGIASAQTTSCGPGGQAEGLISGQFVQGKFGNTTQVCILDPKAGYANYKVDTFESLLAKFFTKASASSSVQKLTLGDIDQDNLKFTGNSNYLVSAGNIRIRGNITGSNTAIVFANGNLEIESDINYGNGSNGLVFIVKGDVRIHQSVTRIDAVIVSEGIICTAYEASTNSCTPANSTPVLTINGSLISLNQDASVSKPIVFGRVSSVTRAAAEIINQQPKYLVILKGLFTNNYSIQREVNLAENPNLVPPPPPPPPPPPAQPTPTPVAGSYCNGNPYIINANCLIDALLRI